MDVKAERFYCFTVFKGSPIPLGGAPVASNLGPGGVPLSLAIRARWAPYRAGGLYIRIGMIYTLVKAELWTILTLL